MSRSHQVEQHLHQLQELQTIIASMKTLSQLELHKLGGRSASLHAMAEQLQTMAADFHQHHPQGEERGDTLWLMLGSERGFCGDFNESLIQQLQQLTPDAQRHPERVLAVGRKLWTRLDEWLPGYTPLPGASVSEELQPVLSPVVDAINRRMSAEGLSALAVLYHDDESGGVSLRRLLPPELPSEHPRWPTPPVLNLSTGAFMRGFLQHYLLLGLNELFTFSLLAENQFRVRHLEGAVQRLDDRLGGLSTRAKSLRQEEITEEIEMILLGTESGA